MTLVRRLVPVLVLLTLLVFTGCGSASPTSVSASPPSPSASASTLTARQELRLYMDALLAIEPAVDAVDKRFSEAKKSWDQDDYSTWPRFRKRMSDLADDTTKIEARVAAVTPPPSLARPHKWLLRAWEQQYEMAFFIAEKVRLEEPYSEWYEEWESRFMAAAKASHKWEVALRAEACRLNLRVPKSLVE